MNTTRRHRTPWRRSIVSVLAVGLVAAACGGDGGDGGGDGEGADGGTITVGNPVTVVSLDPHGAQSAERSTLAISVHIMDTLLEREGDELVGRLATEWDTPDDNTWVFQLRDDVEFHDGTPFTAEDVVASYDRLIEQDGPLVTLWSSVESVEATGDHEVTFSTSEPLGTMLTNLTLLFIGPADRIDEDGFWRTPVGTGAFEVEEFVPDSYTRLVANDAYWDGAPSIDRLEFREIPEVSARMTALETGEIDFTWAVPPDQVSRLESIDQITLETIASFTYYFVWFNNSEEPFTDERVRRAMWHAIDTEQIANDLFEGVGEVGRAPISQAVFGASERDQYEYDPDLARELLAEAGYEDGFSTSIQWNSECCPNIRPMVQALVSYWQQIGVEVELLEKERAVWLDDLLALNWDMNIQDNTVLTGDADYALGRLYLSDADRLGYANPDLDEVLLDARRELDQDRRVELYTEAADIIWEDAAGIFPIDLLNNFAWRDNVQGFEPSPDDTPRFRDVSVTG